MHGGFGGHGGHGGGGYGHGGGAVQHGDGGGHHGGGHHGDGGGLGSLLGGGGHGGHHGGFLSNLAHALDPKHGGGHGAAAALHHQSANHPQNALNWNSALQGEKLADKLWKIDKRPGLQFFLFFSAMILWLFVIHFLHHKEDPNHLVSRSTWNQQMLNSRQGGGPEQQGQQAAIPAGGQAGQEPINQTLPQQTNATAQQANPGQASPFAQLANPFPQQASPTSAASAAPAAFGDPTAAYQAPPPGAPRSNLRIYSAQYATPFNRGYTQSAGQYGSGIRGSYGGQGQQNQQVYAPSAQQYANQQNPGQPAQRYKMVVSR